MFLGKNMTRKELAKNINVSVDTLGNWEKNKPELIKLINLGLHADQMIKQNNQFNKSLKEIRQNASQGKLILPKDDIDEMEIIDIWNIRDFDSDRVMEICRLFSTNSIEKIKKPLLDAMLNLRVDDDPKFRRISNAKSKKMILDEIEDFLWSNNNDLKSIDNIILKNFNQEMNFNFNYNDKLTVLHIKIYYDMYNKKYKIEKEIIE